MVKSALCAFGLFLASILMAVVLSGLVFWLFSAEGLASVIVSMSPVVGIGAAVGYLKEQWAKRAALKGRETGVVDGPGELP